MKKIPSHIRRILEYYPLSHPVLAVEKIEKGHINDSYKLATSQGSFFLQKINPYVFQNPIALSNNIQKISLHNQQTQYKNSNCRRNLTLILTIDKQAFVRIAQNEYWRMFRWIENTISYSFPQTPAQAYQAGRALADFQFALDDFDTEILFETIPDFHNTQKRYQNFLSICKADRFGRLAHVMEEIRFFQMRQALSEKIQNLLKADQLPIRVTHNDPKMDNILLDRDTGEAVCMIDFDTIMPGTLLFDFGDLIRTCAVTAGEDEKSLKNVRIDLGLFSACVKGYASIANQFIKPVEKEHLFLGAHTIIFEQALRFFTDYLDGDQYYKVDNPEHNLERARNQIKLVKSLEQHALELKSIIKLAFL